MPGTAPTKKTLYLVRHAQAEHNVTLNWDLRDAILTAYGRKQSMELNDATADTIQETAELMVCSVNRRPMETMILGFPKLRRRLEAQGKRPIILDTLQECGEIQCDIPLYPLEELKNSQDGIFKDLDFSRVTPEYASKKGIFDPNNTQERAKKVRQWLRDRPEGEIVVVAHGDILRTIVGQKDRDFSWENTEIRVYTFASSTDEQAALTPSGGRIKPKHATAAPTSSEIKG